MLENTTADMSLQTQKNGMKYFVVFNVNVVSNFFLGILFLV